ncbi:disulfide bond formation protein B [Candidatus Gottesmanbacteria bacterium]|nr:disulfide bond formation protein B [Candidatus Gottesmanbacteria bacterium]
MVDGVISFLSILTLIANIVILLFLFLKKFRDYVITIANKYGLVFAYIVSIIATLGSLFLSEVAHFTPCLLCWYQRILMYPQAIILLVALFMKFTKEIKYYCIALSGVGFVLAIYHYYLQLFGNPAIPCSTVGISESCATRPFTHFGYITIPFMAATAFLLIILSMLFTAKIQSKG